MNKDSGKIQLYLGCMFSGKTSELIREYTRYSKINRKVLCINYTFDNRYGEDDYVYSHDLNKVKCLKEKKLMNIDKKTILDYDVILINEGQFFEDILEFCKLYCDIYNKHIIVCGLDGDYLRQPFGQIKDLISIADEYVKLKAFCKVCDDGTTGVFTWRISQDTSQVSINNDYIPVCRKHYLELSGVKSKKDINVNNKDKEETMSDRMINNQINYIV